MVLALFWTTAAVGCSDAGGPPTQPGSGGQAFATGGTNPAGGAPGQMASGGATAAGGASSGGASQQGAGGQPAETLAPFEVEVKLASDVDPDAPTTVGIVTWSLADHVLDSATIEFGLDQSYGTVAPVDLAAPDHRTLLLGMKPMSTYHFRIVAKAGTATLSSEDFTVTTGAPFSEFALGSFDVKDPSTREPGYILTSFWRGDSSSVVFILDADGEVVWWYDSQMNGVARARMSADGQMMWMIEPSNQGAPISRVSMDTLEGQVFSDVIGSHDLTAVSGSTMAFLEYGESDCDSIYEIEPNGTTKEVWESEGQATQQQMCHGNALRFSKKENVYTFSDVSTDVWVVTRDGQFQWGLAERVEGGVNAWGGTNHGHHLLDDSIIIFANRGAGNMLSTVVEYDLDGNELFEYDGGEFSANLGDVQRLPGGNTLITYSNAGVIHEVTQDQELVLEVTTAGQSFGYALWMDSLYAAPADIEL